MSKNTYGIIMAGGVGSRFWPLSTTEHPKQFHDILGTGRTFLQNTFDRLKKTLPVDQIYVVTLKEYEDLCLQQLPEITKDQLILEPMGKNTAVSNLYSAKLIYEKNPEAVLVVAPSDHVILEETAFIDKLNYAMQQAAQKEILVTLGIRPTRPDTGYGYIQYLSNKKSDIKKVKTFTEKPGLELAELFCKSGDFLWNSGVFIWKASTVIEAFKEHLPDMYDSFEKLKNPLLTDKGKKEIQKIYATLQMISIDHGILEKAENVYVIPSSFGWSDLGTWKSLFENSKKETDGNVINGKFILNYNTSNSLICTTQNKAIIVEGLENYIVVDTESALLVCSMEKDQLIKTFVSDLKLNKGEKFI